MGRLSFYKGGAYMGLKWKTEFDDLPKMTATTKALSGKKIKVGAFNGDHAWLAGIHENGAHIQAKNAQYLTVPICPEAAGKKASDFKDLFVYTSKKGNKMLAKKEGKSIKCYFWLTPSVDIPPRPFLAPAHDENAKRILKQTERLLGQVIAGKASLEDVYETYGEQMATAVKKFMRDLKSPSDSPITQNVKGDDNPLVGKTNALINSISYEVE